MMSADGLGLRRWRVTLVTKDHKRTVLFVENARTAFERTSKPIGSSRGLTNTGVRLIGAGGAKGSSLTTSTLTVVLLCSLSQHAPCRYRTKCELLGRARNLCGPVSPLAEKVATGHF